MPVPSRTRGQRFLASWLWLILRNIIGWALILVALTAGPLVPGPGGLPLFLIGFTLISFLGKRRLTARALRGKPVPFNRLRYRLTAMILALALAAPTLWLARSQLQWVNMRLADGLTATLTFYVIISAILWLIALVAAPALNVTLRIIAATRHKFRPWLRRHHIHLLPPRWRPRLGHEPGTGPFQLPEEILKFYRRR